MFYMNHLSCPIVVSALFCSNPAIGQVINEDMRLNVPEQVQRDIFGASVAISGDTVAVGAILDDDLGDASGSAYLFDLNTGEMTFKLLPSLGHFEMEFGNSIDIDGDVVAVGAAFTNLDNWGLNGYRRGAVFLFDRLSGEEIWVLTDEERQGQNGAYGVGSDISMSDGVIGVGALWDNDQGNDSGSGFVFDVDSGLSIQKVFPVDETEGCQFGETVAVSDGLIAIGATRDSVRGEWSGSVHVYDAMSGLLIQKISPEDGESRDFFGCSVALEDGLLVVGAFGDDDSAYHSGAVYIFDAYSGEQLDKIHADDADAHDIFGSCVAISDGIIAVGAPQDNDFGIRSGSAYLFRASTGKQIAKLLPSDGAPEDVFGRSIDIFEGRVVVSAVYDDSYGINSGSAYVFTAPQICEADLNGDGTLNYIDVSEFMEALMDGDRAADFTNDGRYNFFDVSDFISSYIAGCP
ncbi:MAG: FG-GAP repeat protein [Phycisphaerales bacterium]|nr:FG-GAP repeat protein [Phycisphaerales bacterium]